MNRECGRSRLPRGRLAGFARAPCDSSTYRKRGTDRPGRVVAPPCGTFAGRRLDPRVRGLGRDDDSSSAERGLGKGQGEEEARATPGVTDLQITARLHDYIAAWPEGSSYLGFLFARSQTAAEVEKALRDAHARIAIYHRAATRGRAPSDQRHDQVGTGCAD